MYYLPGPYQVRGFKRLFAQSSFDG
jgi:hypothetical protein